MYIFNYLPNSMRSRYVSVGSGKGTGTRFEARNPPMVHVDAGAVSSA